MSIKTQLIVCSLALLLMGGREVVEARSTFTARFASGGIAGPDLEQTAVLYLHYFPGDGEALVGAELGYDLAALNLKSVRSSLGKVRSVEPLLEVDYREGPLGRESIDTLYIDLTASRVSLETRWWGKIFSSLDSVGEVAHTTEFGLEIEEPIQFQIKVRPQRVYPGQQVDLELVVHNVDPHRRVLEELAWEWPEGLTVVQGESEVRWAEPLASGQRDTILWQCNIEREEPGFLVIGGRAGSAQIAGSPVSGVRLQIATVPRPGLHMDAAFLEVGQQGRFVYTWSNRGAEDIEVAEFRLEIPEAFVEVGLVHGVEGASITGAQNGRKEYILVKDPGRLAPGQSLELEIQATPLHPGPFPWKSSFKPVEYFWHIPLAGKTMVSVMMAREGQRQGDGELDYPTDLQLLGSAFDKELERVLEGLSLPRGTQIYLQPDGEEKANWLVEDVLTRALMHRGYQISLKAAEVGEMDEGVMYYRMTDSRIVYTPRKKRLNLFGSRRLRQAYGDLFLRLERVGKVAWANRVPAYITDEVPADKMELLGGSDMVERTIVEPDFKLIERGLSASIIGGLLYIFFVP